MLNKESLLKALILIYNITDARNIDEVEILREKYSVLLVELKNKDGYLFEQIEDMLKSRFEMFDNTNPMFDDYIYAKTQSQIYSFSAGQAAEHITNALLNEPQENIK